MMYFVSNFESLKTRPSFKCNPLYFSLSQMQRNWHTFVIDNWQLVHRSP